MSLTPVNTVNVGIDFGHGPSPVGRLAIRERKIYFEYDRSFIARSLELSPLRLPLQPGLQSFDAMLFERLPGAFNDSLPDGWGRLLLDRAMRAEGILPEQLSPLDRLAHVGSAGMGALIYEPDKGPEAAGEAIDLDLLAGQAQAVLEGQADEVLAELIALNGSSAGARPKAMIGCNPATGAMIHGGIDLPDGFEHWLVKFQNAQDGPDAGAIEYVYAQMAKSAGLDMMEAHLFPAQKGAGFFATRRFDRDGRKRLHAHTASGLLHADHRTPSLDYEDLMALTMRLTRDIREAEKMFRLAAFNVLAHNRDDHAKNFTFLMDEGGNWRLSPAYDLTFSAGPGGEQTTMVLGEGKAPGTEHLMKLGLDADLPLIRIQEIIAQTRDALVQWSALASAHGVRPANIKLIESRISSSNK
ncbi:MAG: type II toxin-antitoxin system HipA family toxin [Alphaproteobacteria bacterium]|nr:type II toxin-antitoxin system HipA family toxin [Alphaproteobacteria bacterium]MBU2083885.1 type II toxin-antitoxin system HipA family toxin [Alphaproteobacteria bacterium]MBU2142962.1 type II toxin-antitoxin system HipA family toxin [Alphaproteobacteria bacterium]MBU2197176.1 type II toxin-antitoxin system HipA family toxin [Alphaproteobacteria bacterium]